MVFDRVFKLIEDLPCNLILQHLRYTSSQIKADLTWKEKKGKEPDSSPEPANPFLSQTV
jgi:hypothetical protein